MIGKIGTYYENTKLEKNKKPTPSWTIFPLEEHSIFRNCEKIFRTFYGNLQMSPNDNFFQNMSQIHSVDLVAAINWVY